MRRRIQFSFASRTRVSLALAAIVFASCTSKEKAPDTARAAESAAVAPAPNGASALAGSPPPAAAMPGQLTKPIDQYTGEEFYDFVQRLKFGGGVEKERKCKGDPQCDGARPSKETLVRVDAVDGQDSLSAQLSGPNGVVAVRAQNRGTLVEDRYGLKPDKQIEYYIVVLPGAGQNGRWQLEEVVTTPGSRSHTKVGDGVFRSCEHPYRPGRVNRANFYTCNNSPQTDSVQRSGLVMFDPKTDPVWVDCAHGCCIAE